MISSSRKISSILTLTALMAGLSSCQLDDMADSTSDMQKTTGEMADTTGRMADTTEEMADTTNKMASIMDIMNESVSYTYEDLRPGNSLTIRRQQIFSMNQIERLEGKLLEAAPYFKSFEFQIWKRFEWDNEEKRLVLFDEGVEEFLLDVGRYVPEDRAPDPTSTANEMKNLCALAATMEQMNSNQPIQAKVKNFKPVSMIDLLQDGLNMRKDVESGKVRVEDLPTYQRKVLEYAPDAIFILQLRANFYATMALTQISDIQKTGITGLLEKIDMYFTDWNAKIGRLEMAQIKRATAWMNESNRIRDYLLSIDVHPKINSTVKKLYRNMKINANDIPAPDSGSPRRTPIEALLQSIDEFRK